MRETVLLNTQAVQRAIMRLAYEILERTEDDSNLVLLGIQTGGVPLAERLAQQLTSLCQKTVPAGRLDVSMHRDDLSDRAAPPVHLTQIPCDINGRTVILVDDVLFRGRTVRAAMDALNDFGRARRIQLAVLIDRGHRELPVRADYVGKNVPTSLEEDVIVRLTENEGRDEVILTRKT